MELVYLWVEDYTNIQKQGFNFSPRFNCHYDGEELTIKDNIDKDGNKQYIENFFDEKGKINITAIVGKNGSGKSSVLDLIPDILIASDSNLYSNPNLLLFSHNKKLYKKHNSKFTIQLEPNIEIETIDDKKCFYNIYKNLAFTSITDKLIKEMTRDHKDINLLEEEYSNKYINKILVFNSQHQYLSKDIIDNFFVPSKLIITVNEDILRKYANSKDNLKEGILQKISTLKNQTLCKKIEIIIDIFKEEGMTNIFDKFKMEYQITNELKIPSLIKENTSTRSDYEFPINQIDEDMLEFIELLPNILELNFIDEKKSIDYNKLSYGEKQLLIQFHLILYYSYKNNYIISDFDTQTNEKLISSMQINSHLILLDEIELALHPNWQKKIIENIVNVLSLCMGIDFHIILTTHSPFLLSDIPKQNIIFLNKDEKGNCKVVDGFKDKKQTFGANIHTLLSDGFFMEDGLMGEFAKNKINEIKDFYEKVIEEKKTDENTAFYHQNQKKFWQIQKIIGEPFLQKIVKNQLEEIELMLLGRDEAIDNEIARLQDLKKSLKDG